MSSKKKKKNKPPKFSSKAQYDSKKKAMLPASGRRLKTTDDKTAGPVGTYSAENDNPNNVREIEFEIAITRSPDAAADGANIGGASMSASQTPSGSQPIDNDTGNTNPAVPGEAPESSLTDKSLADSAETQDENENAWLIPAPAVEIPRGGDGTAFEESLAVLKPEDITDSAEKGESSIKQKKKASIIQTVLLCIFGSVFVVCLVLLGRDIWGKIHGNALYDNASGSFSGFTLNGGGESKRKIQSTSLTVTAAGDSALQTLYDRINSGKSDNIGKSEYSRQLEAMRASLTALRDANKEVYGWIHVEDTHIDYPIMKGSDNEYYLDHAYTGEFLPIGSIFLDCDSTDPLTDSYNTVIYGHNITTGAMFHDVTKFLDADFFKEHDIYIYTMDGVYIYTPIASYQTNIGSMYYQTQFASESSFLSFAAEMISMSKVQAGQSVVSGDTIITLSTCTNGAQDDRYVVQAKLKEVLK